MSITNYSELQAAIAKWLWREGDSVISAIAPDLIRFCEDRINYGFGVPGEPFYSPALRVRQMQERAIRTLAEYVSVPSDFLEVIAFKTNTNPETALQYVSPHQFAETAAAQNAAPTKVYTIIGDEFRFGPVSADTAELWYYTKIPALSDSNPTNWLLTLKPDLYLFGSLVEAAPYIGDDARVNLWFSRYTGLLNGLMAQDERAKYGGSPLIMRSGSPTP